jgi:hypothetical protein
VLFAKSGAWWVQPFSDRPFTAIREDSVWVSSTHIGTAYAALLVDRGYSPPRITDALPTKSGAVAAVAIMEGRAKILPAKTIQFSGYEWEVLEIPSDSGGVMHANRAANAWTDGRGWLHLRIAREGNEWTCAEINLLHGLGYGSYSFLVHRIRHWEPGSVLGMFTWDAEAGQDHREMDIELSQWGDPAAKNAQFVVQPYYMPANVFRYVAPSMALSYSFRWEPGSVSFRTMPAEGKAIRSVAEHLFTSGVPAPGNATLHINLYTYGKSRTPQRDAVEVVFEKFEFLP